MPKPLVSVVMPYRDAEATVREAIESVLDDGYGEIELVAVDDGSRDGSAEVVSRVAARDGRVVRVGRGRRGIVAALEAGIAASSGELVARMDADDLSVPGRLGAQVEMLEGDPGLGVVGTRVRAFPEAGVTEGLAGYLAWQNALLAPEQIARELFVESPFCHPSVMLRRSALEAVGGYRDTPWAEDYDLWLRLNAAGYRMAKVPAVGLWWRRHERQLTFSDPRYALERYRAARARYLAPWLLARSRPVAVWGAGQTGKRTARAFEREGVRAAFFVDIDPKKRSARGARVMAPESLERGEATLLVAVGAKGARALVRSHLAARGFEEGEDFVCVA